MRSRVSSAGAASEARTKREVRTRDLAVLLVGTKAAAGGLMKDRIRDGIGALRAAGAVLQHKWRSRPKGEELGRHLAAVERGLDQTSLDALVEFLVRMRLVSDSILLRDVLDAAEAMFEVPPRFDIRVTNNGRLEVQSLTAEESAEITALGPQHGDGDDCAVCKVLARQREAKASAAGN